MKIIKEYVTGAKVYRFDNARSYDPSYVGFDDCESCGGDGYFVSSGYKPVITQCLDCALRHGSTEFYNYQKVYKNITRQVKQEIKVNARGKLGSRFAEVENFNINHPLAQAYRKLLQDVWGWVEPELVK